ncbi:aminotransferase family protein [Actinomarinicola tropica]|nr:aminotransferase class III-fold pyridoxal phosphate-dependent enzyme [Actinomarinicola tropica]
MASNDRYPIIPGPVALHVVRTEGRHLVTADGRRILDAGGGALVTNIGHGRAEVAEVAARAMQQVTYVLPPWPTDARVELVHRVLDEWMPPSITRAGFTSGGSESVDTAIRLARQHHLSAGRRDRWKVIGRRPSYHGVTVASLAVGGHDDRRAGFEPLFPGFPHVPWDDADALDAAIREAGVDTVAAFIAEPIVGSSAGALVADEGYWRRVEEICREHGVLLIVDEVMTGFGRTGRRMGLEHWDIEPDIVVGGKGLSGGYAPIGGVYATDAVVDPIAAAGDSLMFFTYGAQDVACAVASAVLRILDEEDLVARAATQGEALRRRLDDALGDHPHVAEVRGRGLMLGVDLVADRDGDVRFPREAGVFRRVVAESLARDVWIYPSSSGPDAPDAVMFGPAFTVTDEELDTMVEVLVASIDAAVAAFRPG